MRIFIFFIFSFITSQAQTCEKAYLEIINEAGSTGGCYLLVSVKNLNTNTSKEIFTHINTLYRAIEIEFDTNDREFIINQNIKFYSSHTYTFKNVEALTLLGFNKSVLLKEKEIDNLFTKKSLLTKLQEIIDKRNIINLEHDNYSQIRNEIIYKMSDSIKNIREISEEEVKMLKNLYYPYFDNHYQTKSKILSEKEKRLFTNFMFNIKIHKIKNDNLLKEYILINKKYFLNYYKKFGIDFCHIAARYGAVFCWDDFDAMLVLSDICK